MVEPELVARLGLRVGSGDRASHDRRLHVTKERAPWHDRRGYGTTYFSKRLRGKGVTLALLWEEYKAVHPEGLQYSRFCEQYRAWASKLDVVMRQEHRAGEKLFVDYAGHTVGVVDRHTGELRQAQVFVAVLGASSYTYAEATWTARRDPIEHQMIGRCTAAWVSPA